jgi:hypothetical protein
MLWISRSFWTDSTWITTKPTDHFGMISTHYSLK